MHAEYFIDTNILLYAVSTASAEMRKSEISKHLLLNEVWGWSVQVAAEFYVNATSPKRRLQLPVRQAVSYIDTWLVFPIVNIEASDVLTAIQLSKRYQLSYWDAAIIAAAQKHKCTTLYSEDLSSGQIYDGVTVVNPFSSMTVE